MQVNVTILVENTTSVPGLIAEFGFAALVTVDEKTFLFDTGSGDALLRNAEAIGIDLSQVHELVLSHGHFDHSGGVAAFLQTAPGRKIYAHAGIFIPRYTVDGDRRQDIGVQFSPAEIAASGAQMIFTNGFTEIGPGVFVTGEIPRQTSYEDVGGSFYTAAGGTWAPDLIPDDMSMVIDHPQGLIIISGCAHAGIINTIDYACRQTGQNKIQAFIGGTHLNRASEARMAQTIAALQEMELEQLIVCHCTGFEAIVKLRNALGTKVIKGETAMRFRFG